MVDAAWHDEIRPFMTALEYIGTFAGAMSGVRLACYKRFDWFGAYVIGFVTALGGGTLRDIMLGVTPFWMTAPSYLFTTFLAVVAVWLFGRRFISGKIAWCIFDTIAISVFMVIGLEKSIRIGVDRGIDSFADGFQEKSGLYAQPVALEDLQAVTAYFARQVAQTAPGVARDEDGVFAEDRRAILENSVRAYDALEAEYPFLVFADTGVKPVYFSRFLSALDFTGIYCPFTGESNVNVDSPASMLPATAAHELAHQRGITSEQECNFLAILASTTCGDEVYAYSGWLSGYIYLGNALYRVDPEAYWAIRSALPETVQADLRSQNEYWDQFEDKAAQKVSNRVYDSFLKGYGQELGLQSYGNVVDLLVTYYKDRI